MNGLPLTAQVLVYGGLCFLNGLLDFLEAVFVLVDVAVDRVQVGSQLILGSPELGVFLRLVHGFLGLQLAQRRNSRSVKDLYFNLLLRLVVLLTFLLLGLLLLLKQLFDSGGLKQLAQFSFVIALLVWLLTAVVEFNCLSVEVHQVVHVVHVDERDALFNLHFQFKHSARKVLGKSSIALTRRGFSLIFGLELGVQV